jgi:L-malate glycosyltransferase
MIRLIHLANYPNPHGGSFIPLLLAVFDQARARGWTTDACFIAGIEDAEWVAELEGRGVSVHIISPGSRVELTRRVAAVLGESELPTVLHTHFTAFDVPAAVAARRRGDCALLWHIHTLLGTGVVSQVRNTLKLILFRGQVDRIIVPADNIGDALERRWARRDRIMLLPSPIDPAAYRPASAERRGEARRALGIPEGSYALLHIGRAWELKGGDIYLRAVRELRDHGVPVTALTLRGGDEARQDVRALGLGESVTVLERVEDIRDLYAAADCFVASSRGEGMPFSVVEALASGIPVVASDHLPVHRYLSDQVPACVTVPGDPASIAGAVRAMFERPAAQVASEAEGGRAWIAANLNLEVAAERLLGAYEAAARRRGLDGATG